MDQGVTNVEAAAPEQSSVAQAGLSDKEMNFRRLEAMRNEEREARIRAELQTEYMQKELQSIKQMLQPQETDPLDGVEDYVEAKHLRAKLEKERALLKKEAEEIAKRTYENLDREKEQKNFLSRLKNEYRDFDDVVNEENVLNLEKTNPVFLKAIAQIPDDYERRKLAYEYIKAHKAPAAPMLSIKEKVEENQKNPFYIPAGSGNPSAVDYDLKSPAARASAYAKLKANQRRPIGSGSTQV